MRAQELEAIFEAMTGWRLCLRRPGAHYPRSMPSLARSWGPRLFIMVTPIPERVALQSPLDEKGQPLPFEQLPSVRILHGEVLTGAQAVDVYLPHLRGRHTGLTIPAGHLCAVPREPSPAPWW